MNPENCGMVGRDAQVARLPRAGRRGVLEERIEQQLDAEIVDGTAEEDRRHVAGQDGQFVERLAGGIEHVELLDQGLEGIGRHALAHLRIGDGMEGLGGAVGSAAVRSKKWASLPWRS